MNMYKIPTTKEVRCVVRSIAAELGIDMLHRCDGRGVRTYTDRTNGMYENERLVVFDVGNSRKAYRLGLEVAVRMSREGYHIKFGTSQGGYLRVYAVLG